MGTAAVGMDLRCIVRYPMGMQWVIENNSRCDLLTFSGINLSGHGSRVQIFPSGRQGDITSPISSLIIAGMPGLQVILCSMTDEMSWEDHPWRAIELKVGSSFRTKDGRLAVRIPDLENLDRPSDQRMDPDFQCSYDHVESLAARMGWTYGRTGPLRGRVHQIRIGRVPVD